MPIPLLWETATAYATRDYYTILHWLGLILVCSAPALTLVGAMLLPLRLWPRIALAALLLPLGIMIEGYWGFTYVYAQFGDCL
jgi:hypothetical protein